MANGSSNTIVDAADGMGVNLYCPEGVRSLPEFLRMAGSTRPAEADFENSWPWAAAASAVNSVKNDMFRKDPQP